MSDDKMFAFDVVLRGETMRAEGWFSGHGPDDPFAFDIDAVWRGWTKENRQFPFDAGGPEPIDLSTLTEEEEEAIDEAAWAAVAALFPEQQTTTE